MTVDILMSLKGFNLEIIIQFLYYNKNISGESVPHVIWIIGTLVEVTNG